MPVFILLMLHLFYFEKGWEERDGKCSFSVPVKCKGSTTVLKKKNVFKQLFSICEVVSYDNMFSFPLWVKHLHSSIVCKYTWDFCWLLCTLLEENLEGQNEFCAASNSCLHWQKTNKTIISLLDISNCLHFFKFLFLL